MFSTRAMLLLIDCKYKVLSKQPHYQKLLSVPDEKPSKQSNGNAVDVEIKELKPKVTKFNSPGFAKSSVKIYPISCLCDINGNLSWLTCTIILFFRLALIMI